MLDHDELSARLEGLVRPRLMIRAARFGMEDYRRDRDLKRIFKAAAPKSNSHALLMLMDAEERLEETRLTDDANYDIVRHVDLLIALMAEARLFRDATLRPQAPGAVQTKASGSAAFLRATKSFSASAMPGSSAGA